MIHVSTSQLLVSRSRKVEDDTMLTNKNAVTNPYLWKYESCVVVEGNIAISALQNYYIVINLHQTGRTIA